MKAKRQETQAANALDRLLASERRRLDVGAGLSVLSALIWPAQAALIAALFAALLTAGEGIAPAQAALGFFAMAIARIGIATLSEALLFDASEAILESERSRIVKRESRAAEPSKLGGPGAMAALISEKLEALRPFVLRYATARARVMVLPLVILFLSFWQSWAVGLVLLVAGPLIPVFMALVGWAAKEASERQMLEIGRLGDLLVDRLAALPDLQLLDAGPAVVLSFEAAAEDLRARTMAVLRIAFLSSTVLELFAALGVAMVAIWVGFSLLGEIRWGTWGAPLTPFAGMFLLLLAPEYFQPFRDLAVAWHDKAAAEAVAAELAAWEFDAPPEILGKGDKGTALSGPLSLSLKNVVSQRGDRRIAFPDIEVTPGSNLAITGKSGAGKTTLLRLIAGLERPVAGQIEVASQPLDDDTADSWRAHLGWLPQMPHFLNRSLRHNIAFGAPIDRRVIRDAVLEDVLAELPRGANTVIGETGAGLSGGEARRVMLARAIQARPDFLLADEPTADLDPETAARVMDGLLGLARTGTTLIIATHDPALLAKMDRVVELRADVAEVRQ